MLRTTCSRHHRPRPANRRIVRETVADHAPLVQPLLVHDRAGDEAIDIVHEQCRPSVNTGDLQHRRPWTPIRYGKNAL